MNEYIHVKTCTCSDFGFLPSSFYAKLTSNKQLEAVTPVKITRSFPSKHLAISSTYKVEGMGFVCLFVLVPF